jgi:hypothetical protein
LINSGSEIYYSNIAEEIDILGNPRKYGDSILNGHWLYGQVDIGAFEYMNNPVPEIEILDQDEEEFGIGFTELPFPDTYVEQSSTIPITINNLGNDFLDDGMLVLEVSIEGDPNCTRQFRIEIQENGDNTRRNGRDSRSNNFYSHTTREDNTSGEQDRKIILKEIDFTESSDISTSKEEPCTDDLTDPDNVRVIPLIPLDINVYFEPDCYGYYSCNLRILNNDDDESDIIIPLSGLALSSEINICAEVDNELKNLDELLEMDYFVFDSFPANNEPSNEEKEFIIQNRGNSIMDTLEIHIPFGFEVFDLGEEVIQGVPDNSIVTKSNSNKNDKQFSYTKSTLSSPKNTAKKRDEKSLGDNLEGWFREIMTIDIPVGMQHRFKLRFRSYKLGLHPIDGFEGNMIIISDDRKNNEDNDPDWDVNTALDESTIEIELRGEGTPIVFSSAYPNIDPNQISGNISSDWRIICPEVLVYEDIIIHSDILLNINKCDENLEGDPEPDPVIFRFVENHSILVEGQIIAEGDEEDFIMFKDFDDTDQYYWQGIIFDDNLSSLLSEIDYCEIMEAHSSAIKSIDFSNLFISNCYLHDNLSTNGAAIYCENSDITAQNNLITLNEATQNGGALYSLNSLIQLMNNTVENNIAPNGGGIFLDENRNNRDDGTKTKKHIRERTLRGEIDCTTALIFANYIQNNTASQNGGGIYSNMNEVTIKSNVFDGNESINGGGIYVTFTSNNLFNNTIIGNNAVSGAGIYCYTGFPVIQNNIVWDNVANDDTQIFPSYFNQNVSYNIIQDNECDQFNNLDHDPGFVGTGYHPYCLTERSICINGGDRSFSDEGLDILGNLRITQEHGRLIIDIGAYEYIGEYIVVDQYEIDKVDYYDKRFISYSPAHIISNLDIDQILEISPKTTFDFDESLYIEVSSSGRLLAQGKENEEIAFTSESKWGGIRYDANETVDDLEYCLFYNGESTNGGAIRIDAITNFNLNNCGFYNNYATENGGAIHIEQSSNNISIIECIFQNNVCQENGGAISIVNSGIIQIDNSSFIGNIAQGNGSSNGYGGGVYCYDSNLNVQNSSFDENMTNPTTGLCGGAICGRGYSSTNCIQYNNFVNNTARGIGGAMYFENTNPNITDNFISFCSSQGFDPKLNSYPMGYGGGAIALYQCYTQRNSISKNIIENCVSEYGAAINIIYSTIGIISNIIRDNNAINDGGGMYFLNSSCSVKWNMILNNTAQNGGGIYSNISVFNYEILNNYFYDNMACYGGGVYFYIDVNPDFVNNTMRNNNASAAGADIFFNGTHCDVNNSIMYNEFPQTFSIDLENETELINVNNCLLSDKDAINNNYSTLSLNLYCYDEDPEFVNEQDFHILSTSICCDAGDNTYVTDVNLTIDLDGENRIIDAGSGAFVDIGADEYNETIITSNIIEDTEWSGLIRIESSVIILSGVTLTITDNTIIIFEPSSQLMANQATLIIGDFVSFYSENNDDIVGLYTNSTSIELNEAIVTNCNFFLHETTIIQNSNFSNSLIEQEGSIINFNCNSLIQSNVYTFKCDEVICNENIFINNPEITALSLNSCDNYELLNNDISNYETAFWINESGLGKEHTIGGNNIHHNQYGYGIEIYHSYADIINDNLIEYNYIGVAGLRNCNIEIIGSEQEPYQMIHNNYNDETAFAYDSFPLTLRYNIIYDNIFPEEGLYVRCNYAPEEVNFDIRWNYWNNTSNLEEYLFPSSQYTYEPVWDLVQGANLIVHPDQEMYELASYNFDNEYYFLAEELYLQIIDTYPESKYTKLAAQDLLTVTPYTSGDYEGLKIYFREEPNLHYNLEIADFADYLANYCRIELEDYQGAIDWFENYIADPPSVQDSIYAVIDIGYTYLLMGQPDRSYIGRYPQLKPNSRNEFFEKQQNLISLLLSNEEIMYTSSDPEIIIPNYPDLYQNYPNPFNPETTISFSIPVDCKVDLAIYNIKGQKVKTLVNEYLEKGFHNVIWNSRNNSGKQVSSGVYFYQFRTERKQIIRKMLLLK